MEYNTKGMVHLSRLKQQRQERMMKLGYAMLGLTLLAIFWGGMWTLYFSGVLG